MNFVRTRADTRVVRCADFGGEVDIALDEFRCVECNCITVVVRLRNSQQKILENLMGDDPETAKRNPRNLAEPGVRGDLK